MKKLNIAVWQIALAVVLIALYLNVPVPGQVANVSHPASCEIAASGPGVFDPLDLANGRYPHLRRVAIDSPEFRDVMNWLVLKGAPCPDTLYVARGLSMPGDNPSLPAELHWSRTLSGDDPLRLDAALVFNFPHVALVELKHAFRFGNPNVTEMYPGLRKPLVEIDTNPIGAPWPEKGPDAYRPSDYDQRNPLPYGAEVTTPAGRFVREKNGWVFVTYPIWRKVG